MWLWLSMAMAADLVAVGSCPGSVTLTARADPGARVAFLSADAVGSSTVPAGSCAGTPLALGNAGRALRFVTTMGPSGELTLPIQTSAPICGIATQLLDLDSCQTSPVTTLPVGERLSLLDEAVPDTSLPWPSLDHPLQPGARLSGPLPTNAWWLNAALGNGDGVINVLPYLVSVRDDQLAASLAYRVEAPNLVYTFRQDDLRLGAVETLQPPTVTAHDAASVTMTWTAPTGAMTTPLVRGMPYVTAIYDGLRPVVSTEHTIVAVNGQPPGVARSSDTFVVDLSSGQTLTVYASRFVTLDTSPAALTGLAPFDGWLRVAETTPATAAALAAHGDRVPTGAEVRATSQGDVGTLTFDWQTTGSGPLLMMTLPHHRDVLTGPTPVAVSADTIKGEMTGVAGTRWELVEPLTDITWGAPRPIDPQFEPDVRAALQADVNEGIGPLDPYFGGKAIAKVARLALIADELGETALAATYRNRVASALESWLSGTNPIPFR
jgi:endo-1,3(4)-beta-glucanase